MLDGVQCKAIENDLVIRKNISMILDQTIECPIDKDQVSYFPAMFKCGRI